MCDVPPEQYPTVIREMIRHENDLTNHRTMWLLIVQGLIANACVTASRESEEIVSIFATVGILVTLSTFALLYKSYQARGYLQFLGSEAKRGTLREGDLPLFGWPSKRIKGWPTGMDANNTNAAEAQVRNWREESRLPFPDFSPEQKNQLRGSVVYPPVGSPQSAPKTNPDAHPAAAGVFHRPEVAIQMTRVSVLR